ncbi:MAG: hypothetical protein ACKVZ0_18195 [Gemmatimonadales bacterium]
MLEVTPAEAAIVVCAAARSVLDAAPVIHRGLRVRVAPDELWLVGPRAERGALLAAAESLVRDRGLSVDQTDGWWAITATGDERDEVFRRLMVAPIPVARPSLVQGAITGVPGKLICEADRTHVFVPAGVGHHLMDRLAKVTGDLTVRIGPPAGLALENEGASC